MDEASVLRLLDGLASRERGNAWSEFLDAYARLILQVVHRVEWDSERCIDCFVFVCEELSRNRCRRLRRYDAAKGASFSTWVQVITHNLCLDWHRKKSGRFRLFQSVADLSALDEEIYRCIYAQGLSSSETHLALKPDYPDLTASAVAETIERIRQQLTPRQHWLLSSRRPKVVSLDDDTAGGARAHKNQIADPGPNPELFAAHEERRTQLASALDRLSVADRLLVRLRFEEGLSLQQVASFTGMNNAQQADRRLHEVLALLKEEME